MKEGPAMRENMKFLTNYYQIRELSVDRMKEIILLP